MFHGVLILSPCITLSLNFMLITSSVVLLNLGLCLSLLISLPSICTTEPRGLFESAHFTAQYFPFVGQNVSPGKCALLNTSKAVRSGYEALGHFG